MVDFRKASKQAERLLAEHKSFLETIQELSESEYYDYIYSSSVTDTKRKMIDFFRSFDEAKENVKDVVAFNEKCGFTSEYKDYMRRG